MKKILYIIFFGLIAFANFLKAEKMPCRPNYVGIVQQAKMIEHPLPLSISMPEEVIRSYLIMENISKNTQRKDFISFINSQNYYSDTIRSLLRTYHILQDYDALLLLNYSNYGIFYTDNPYNEDLFYNDFLKFYDNNTDYPLIDKSIFKSSFIFHVKITNKYYTNDVWDIVFESVIMDTLKGKIIPNSENILLFPDSNFSFKNMPEKIKTDIGSKFVFKVQDEDRRMLNSPYDEYLIFCYLSIICLDRPSGYFFYSSDNMAPIKYKEQPIFPITKDGIVIDSMNSFGFGSNLHIDEWKSRIRKRIEEINKGEYNSVVNNNNTVDFLFSIFPNPASDNITIFFTDNISNNTLSIYNQMGQEIKKISANELLGKTSINISTEEFSSGIYYCTIINNGNRISKSFVVIR